MKTKASKKRKMDLSMAKEVYLSSVIAPGLVPHVLKGEIKIDSYMLRHGISSVNLDLDFDIKAICELFSIQGWEAFKELWEEITSLSHSV